MKVREDKIMNIAIKIICIILLIVITVLMTLLQIEGKLNNGVSMKQYIKITLNIVYTFEIIVVVALILKF